MQISVVKEGIPLHCPTCQNKWVYCGRNKYFATCSHCRSAVNVRKRMIRAEELQNQKQVGALNDSVVPASKEEYGSHG